jgi:hypothetical protein
VTGKVRHLLNRDGRYFARLVVPKPIRPYLDGKTELRHPLGPDRRAALAKLPGAVAGLQHQIGLAEQRQQATVSNTRRSARYPLAPSQIALRSYHDRLVEDEQLRNADYRYASYGYVDERFVTGLRDGVAGRLPDADLKLLVGKRIDHFRQSGNTSAEYGSDDWRTLARAICISEYEALSRVVERNEGDFTGKPEHPLITDAKPAEEGPATSITFDKIIDDEVARRARGKNAKPLPARTVKKYRDAAAGFANWRKSDDAATVAAVEGKNWIGGDAGGR